MGHVKENSMALPRYDKGDFVQDHHNRYREHCSGILQWGTDLGSTLSTVWASGNFNQGPRLWAVHGKLLRGDIRGKGLLGKLT